MTQNIDAEREAWSQYLVALHAKQEAWIARCIAWGDAVRNDLRGELLQEYYRLNDESHLHDDRERQLYWQWQNIAYPMFDLKLPDKAPEKTSVT